MNKFYCNSVFDDIKEVAKEHGITERRKNSELYEYPITPDGTICPICRDRKVTWGDDNKNRVCEECMEVIDEDDFGKITPASEFWTEEEARIYHYEGSHSLPEYSLCPLYSLPSALPDNEVKWNDGDDITP